MRNVTVWTLGEDVATALGSLAERTMRLQCTVQDGEAWLGSAEADAVKIEWTVLKAPANA
jgi:uncharacterized protein YaeQ